MHQFPVTFFGTPSRMVSPWPSFEYIKFVAFLGTDRPEASITWVARWFFSMFYLQSSTETSPSIIETGNSVQLNRK